MDFANGSAKKCAGAHGDDLDRFVLVSRIAAGRCDRWVRLPRDARAPVRPAYGRYEESLIVGWMGRRGFVRTARPKRLQRPPPLRRRYQIGDIPRRRAGIGGDIPECIVGPGRDASFPEPIESYLDLDA